MANSDKNIVITPNTGSASTPTIVFTGGSNTPGTLTVNDAGTLTFDKQFISSVATGTAPFAVSSTTRVANLNVATAGTADNATLFDSASSLTRTASHRANRNITGGGTISVDGSSNVKWTSRFIVISNGRGAYFSTNGYFDIDCPTSGTITGVGGAASVTATAAGIPLTAWQALYYILPIGSTNGSLPANFRVASYTGDSDIPHTWVLICVRNGDSGVCYFNNGIALKNGESINVATHDARRSIISDTLTTARTIGGVSFDGSANIDLPGVNTAGNQNTSGSARFVSSPDGDRNAGTKLPTTNPNAVRFDFVGAGSTGTGGSYAGLMTYAPWTGTTASTGDASYQLAFGSTATNGSGRPQLNIRNGIDSTWNAWYTLLHSGNTERATWSTFGRSIGLVAGELAWKNYGNSHTIFDASNSTAPNGATINNTNSAAAWTATYPTLMGWNGSSTYGVRVDSARLADTATTANALATGNNYSVNYLKSVNVYDSTESRFTNPNGGSYTTSASSITGAIKIKLPVSKNNSSTMMFFTVKIYQYNGGRSHEFKIGGYNYVLGGWYNQFAINLTDDGDPYTVRFGFDGTSDCVWIGETSTVWYYPQVFLSDMQAGYSNLGAAWGDGWAISFVTAFDSVETSKTPPTLGNTIRVTGDVTAYYSDERLKTFDGTIPNALEKVNSLHGYYFYENDVAKSLGYKNDKRQIGVSAQEVEQVLPEAVVPAPIDSNYLTVKYEKLVPLLIESIKELTEKISILEKRLDGKQ